jgi:alpha-ketoglutarate-dependent taurine dioxygenase
MIEHLRADRLMIRYDKDCMLPADAAFAHLPEALAEVIAASSPIGIEWKPDKVCIIDNWRMLHGRASGEEDDGRRLERVLLGVAP